MLAAATTAAASGVDGDDENRFFNDIEIFETIRARLVNVQVSLKNTQHNDNEQNC